MMPVMRPLALLLLLVVSAPTRTTLATDAPLEKITGEIVDLACYVPHPDTGRGRGHRKCAETCVKKGMPMGLLTESGDTYLLLEDHDSPKPYDALKAYAAEVVTVEGTPVSRGGIRGFVVLGVAP